MLPSRRTVCESGRGRNPPWRRHGFLALLLLVFSIIAWGRQPGVSSAGHRYLTRLDLAMEMATAMKAVGVRVPEKPAAGALAGQNLAKGQIRPLAGKPYEDVDQEQWRFLEPLARAALLRGFLDRTFRPTAPIRWGEVLFHWARLTRFLEAAASPGRKTLRLIESPGIPPNWAWLRLDLATLQRHAILDGAFLDRNRPERVAERTGLEELVARTITAFGGAKGSSLPESPRRSAGLPSAPLPGPGACVSRETPVPLTRREGSGQAPSSDPAGHSPVRTSAAAPSEDGFRDPSRRFDRVSESEGPAIMQVAVLDSISRKPVERAQVVVNGRSLGSDPDGTYRLSQWRKGEALDLLFAADGYQSLQLKHILGNRKEMQILLKPIRTSCRLRLVSAADSRPVKKAHVVLAGQEASANRKGEIEFRAVKPGYYQVEVAADGFQEGRELIFVGENSTTRTLRLHPRLRN